MSCSKKTWLMRCEMNLGLVFIALIGSFLFLRRTLMKQYNVGKIKLPLQIWATWTVVGFFLLQVFWSTLDKVGQ